MAIKVLPAHLAQDPQFSERFIREARAITRLDHPNILQVHDFGQADGVTYIVMKYMDGGIVILYQCPTACEGMQNALKRFFQTAAPDAVFHAVRLVMGPDLRIDSPVVAVAWDWELDLPDVNADLLLDFCNRHVNQARELAP